MSDSVRLPNHRQRTVVIGRTGSGKTVAGIFHLSNENFSAFPWVVFDTKRDSTLRKLYSFPFARRINFASKISSPALYYMQPSPAEMDSEACEAFLWRIHARGNCGIYIDEGYMFNKHSAALNALYTQGRDKNIPIITLTQKPKYLSMFTFSEADFFQVFQLNDKQDRKRVMEFMPADLNSRLRDFHSLWYDVGRNSVTEFSPVPAADRLLEKFAAQSRVTRRVI